MEDILTVGRLVSFRWQIGVGVQSNHCENLSSPFISVQLQVEDPNKSIETHSFDLSLLEFKHFAKHFRDIDELMGSI